LTVAEPCLKLVKTFGIALSVFRATSEVSEVLVVSNSSVSPL